MYLEDLQFGDPSVFIDNCGQAHSTLNASLFCNRRILRLNHRKKHRLLHFSVHLNPCPAGGVTVTLASAQRRRTGSQT